MVTTSRDDDAQRACKPEQYAFGGTGMDLPLLQWLETHTFPVEARFADPSFARKVRTAVAT